MKDAKCHKKQVPFQLHTSNPEKRNWGKCCNDVMNSIICLILDILLNVILMPNWISKKEN